MNVETVVQELRHRTCIGAVAQAETGGSLLLHFGDWQSYESPPDPALLASERGKWSLMIRSPWRLDTNESVVCDWRTITNAQPRSGEHHSIFEGLRVEDVVVTKPANDLKIVFSRLHTLHVLCDSDGDTADCWYLLRPDDSSIAATHDYQLVYEDAHHHDD
jgi:hypothetical protein